MHLWKFPVISYMRTNFSAMPGKSLWTREPPSTRAKFVCFWSRCDNIVFPTRSATLPEADNRHLRATAHVQMALHPDVIDAVLRLVNEPDVGEV